MNRPRKSCPVYARQNQTSERVPQVRGPELDQNGLTVRNRLMWSAFHHEETA
nr:MAG TPA: hypothetical protein [Caudoviricetes sp.]